MTSRTKAGVRGGGADGSCAGASVMICCTEDRSWCRAGTTEVGGGAGGQLPELAGGWTRHRAVSSAGGYRDHGRAPGGPVAPVKSRAGSPVRGQPHGTFSEIHV